MLNCYKFVIHDGLDPIEDTVYYISAKTLDDAEFIANFIYKGDSHYSVSKSYSFNELTEEGYSMKAKCFVPLSVRSIKIDNLIG